MAGPPSNVTKPFQRFNAFSNISPVSDVPAFTPESRLHIVVRLNSQISNLQSQISTLNSHSPRHLQRVYHQLSVINHQPSWYCQKPRLSQFLFSFSIFHFSSASFNDRIPCPAIHSIFFCVECSMPNTQCSSSLLTHLMLSDRAISSFCKSHPFSFNILTNYFIVGRVLWADPQSDEKETNCSQDLPHFGNRNSTQLN
jgi:hypothetical protein